MTMDRLINVLVTLFQTIVLALFALGWGRFAATEVAAAGMPVQHTRA